MPGGSLREVQTNDRPGQATLAALGGADAAAPVAERHRHLTEGGNMGRRSFVAAVLLVGVGMMVAAGPAFADCVNVNRSDNANVQIAAHSPDLSTVSCGFAPCTPFLTLDEALLVIFEAPPGSFYAPDGLGLCEPGAQYLVDQIHVAAAQPGSSIDLNWVVGGEALQSGGLLNGSNPRAQQNLSNGKGIDLFMGNAEIMAVIDLNIATAAGMC